MATRHVDCQLAGGESNTRSLRVKRLRWFRDEATVCRSLSLGLSMG